MSVCPHCHQPNAPTPPPEGAWLSCGACGTRWFARPRTANPYAGRPRREFGPGFQGTIGADEIDAARVIDLEAAPDGARARTAAAPADHPADSPMAGQRPRGGVRFVLAAGGVALGIALGIGLVLTPLVPVLNRPAEASAAVIGDLLSFDRVRSEITHVRDGRRLLVTGEVVNPTWRDLPLPSVQVVLKDETGVIVRTWRVNLARSDIGAKSRVGFRTAVAFPPAAARDVSLRMAPRVAQGGS